MVIFTIIGSLIRSRVCFSVRKYIYFFINTALIGIYGIIFCNIIMGVVIYKTLMVTYRYKIKNYKDFVDTIIPIKTKRKYLNCSYIVSVIVNIFLLMSFFIMITGFGSYFEQEFRNQQNNRISRFK